MRLLLDTVALLYAVESPDQLSKRAGAALRNPANILELSAASLVEIAIKSSLGKLAISESVARQVIEDLNIRILPYTAAHSFHLFGLPLHHRDPFDRQIIAQALSEGISVVSPDRMFERYENLKIVW